jgi:putative thiamine transport system permease protein
LTPTARGGRWLAAAPGLTTAVFLLPVAAGLVGTLLPAFGVLPALGRHAPSLEAWRALAAQPGLATSLRLTLVTGFAAAVLSFVLAMAFCAWAWRQRWARRAGQWLAPVLATPHSALAIGLAFLIAPSGWLLRLASPGLTGFDLPPDVATVGDPAGLALVLGLLVKEVPYLVLMTLGALNQVRADAALSIARSLGYGRAATWFKLIVPQLYPQLRLPVYAVLAFSLSVVDVALVLGPSTPPTLAVHALRLFQDPDLAMYFPAAAAATLQLAIVLVAILAWRLGERLVAHAGLAWVERGGRDGAAEALARAGGVAGVVLFALALLALAGLALWSVATQWRFPDAWPDGLTLAHWRRLAEPLARPALDTLLIAGLATGAALLLALACLEHEADRPARAAPPALSLLYVPLLVPQIAFLFGMQVMLVHAGLDGSLGAVVWAHLAFVLPYLFLSLADPWRAFDPRLAQAAASLGASRWRILLRIKLPMLLRPLLIAVAVGFATSVGQYLATLFAGNGRVATLTTEAITLASGADRRVIGTYAFLQGLFPAIVYLLALAVPAFIIGRRRGLARLA